VQRINRELSCLRKGTFGVYLGGYRPWEAVYMGWVNARGPVIEVLTWVQLPAVYYPLRNADYSPKGHCGGEGTRLFRASHRRPFRVCDDTRCKARQ
jgi:hypothetical protein